MSIMSWDFDVENDQIPRAFDIYETVSDSDKRHGGHQKIYT